MINQSLSIRLESSKITNPLKKGKKLTLQVSFLPAVCPGVFCLLYPNRNPVLLLVVYYYYFPVVLIRSQQFCDPLPQYRVMLR